MITWLKINFGQWPDHVDRPNKFLRCHVSTLLTSQNKEKKLTLDSLQAQNYLLLGLLLNHLRWLNTVLAVCEYTSFAKSRQEKGCSSQAETWKVKIYWWKSLIERSNVTFSWFPWQHERLNTTCDLLATTVSLHVITLVTADWYGSDSSWLISQIKIIETMKLFSAKLLGPN